MSVLCRIKAAIEINSVLFFYLLKMKQDKVDFCLSLAGSGTEKR